MEFNRADLLWPVKTRYDVKQNWYQFLATFLYAWRGVLVIYFRFAWYVTGVVFMALGGALGLVLIIRNKETIFVPGMPQAEIHIEFTWQAWSWQVWDSVASLRTLLPRGRSGTSSYPFFW